MVIGGGLPCRGRMADRALVRTDCDVGWLTRDCPGIAASNVTQRTTGRAGVIHQRARTPDRPDRVTATAGFAGHRGHGVGQGSARRQPGLRHRLVGRIVTAGLGAICRCGDADNCVIKIGRWLPCSHNVARRTLGRPDRDVVNLGRRVFVARCGVAG